MAEQPFPSLITLGSSRSNEASIQRECDCYYPVACRPGLGASSNDAFRRTFDVSACSATAGSTRPAAGADKHAGCIRSRSEAHYGGGGTGNADQGQEGPPTRLAICASCRQLAGRQYGQPVKSPGT